MNKVIKKIGTVLRVGQQTARVEVVSNKRHPIYRKRFSVHKRYLVELPKNTLVKVGDRVSITPTRPLSKRKSWRIIDQS